MYETRSFAACLEVADEKTVGCKPLEIHMQRRTFTHSQGRVPQETRRPKLSGAAVGQQATSKVVKHFGHNNAPLHFAHFTHMLVNGRSSCVGA